jgi:hypothetical protein
VWHEEHPWNVGEVQRVHLSSLVLVVIAIPVILIPIVILVPVIFISIIVVPTVIIIVIACYP